MQLYAGVSFFMGQESGSALNIEIILNKPKKPLFRVTRRGVRYTLPNGNRL